MDEVPQKLAQMGPDKLVVHFSKSRIMLWLMIAIGVHILAIGATSVAYIRDRWVDPEAAAKRKAEELDARKAEAARVAALKARGPAIAKAVAEPPKSPGAPAASAKADEAREKDARKDAPVMKEITKMPKEGEIPKKPDDLGISIDETNR